MIDGEKTKGQPRFQVVDIPHGRRRGKYADLVDALLALPSGKALWVPLGVFPDGKNRPAHPEIFLQMKRRCGRGCLSRRLPDGIYLWLNPVSSNGHGGTQ